MDKLLMTDVIKSLLRFSEVQTDDTVFRFHYKLTATFVLGCSLLVSATQFFGDPIHCVTNDIIPSAIMNNYCWVEGTITLPRSLNGTLDTDVAAPGVDQRKIRDDEPVIEHTYYQWVSLFLFFQAATFYFPRWIWLNWENGRVKRLINELSKSAIHPETRKKNISTIVEYIKAHEKENRTYAYKYTVCELLNLINVIGQLFLLDRFLGYQFWNYGPSAVGFLIDDPENRVDPMSKVFPKMTKCRVRRFGTSGEVQTHDAICLLSLNVINEKIFVFLWFWFVFLAAITLARLIHRSLAVRASNYRTLVLHKSARMLKSCDAKCLECNYGDWFLLSLLKENVKAHHFRDVVLEMTHEKRKGSGEEKERLLKGDSAV